MSLFVGRTSSNPDGSRADSQLQAKKEEIGLMDHSHGPHCAQSTVLPTLWSPQEKLLLPGQPAKKQGLGCGDGEAQTLTVSCYLELFHPSQV